MYNILTVYKRYACFKESTRFLRRYCLFTFSKIVYFRPYNEQFHRKPSRYEAQVIPVSCRTMIISLVCVVFSNIQENEHPNLEHHGLYFGCWFSWMFENTSQYRLIIIVRHETGINCASYRLGFLRNCPLYSLK